MNNIIRAVIVVYNTEFDKSVSFLNIPNRENINISILDNSTDESKKNKNRSIAANLNVDYIDMGGNIGLSKAYNVYLDSTDYNEKDFIVWLDDDSNINDYYFEELENLINSTIDIATPIIQGQDDKIWSPNNDGFLKNKQLKTVVEKVNLKKYNAINSCTAVRGHIYDTYRYDETLFLDQVDHLFFYHQRNHKRNFYQMNTVISHNFSLKTLNKNLPGLLSRYELMIPDFINYGILRKKPYILINTKIIGWGIKESLKYSNPLILFWMIVKTIRFHINRKEAFNDQRVVRNREK